MPKERRATGRWGGGADGRGKNEQLMLITAREICRMKALPGWKYLA